MTANIKPFPVEFSEGDKAIVKEMANGFDEEVKKALALRDEEGAEAIMRLANVLRRALDYIEQLEAKT